jgi:hypothetical protein
MKVLVVGSMRHLDENDSKRAHFIAACRALGGAISRSRHELVVGSDRTTTADRYVVEGAIKDSGVRRVWVYRPESDATPFQGDAIPFQKERSESDRKIKFIDEVMKGPWAAGRIPQVLGADAVIIIGGGSGTAQVGYISPPLERPVLAIPSFGGAAEELWPTLEPFYKKVGPSLRERLGDLRVEWQPKNADLALDMLQEMINRKLFRREKSAPNAILLLFVVALFAAWVWLFSSPPSPRAIAYFALLGVSAFLGAGLRNSLGLLVDPTFRLSQSRILAEVSAGLLLAFGLAIVYLLGGFTITGKFEFISSTAQPEDFQRVGLAMTVLGLMGGWLIERVSESLRSWFAEQLPGQSSGPNGA